MVSERTQRRIDGLLDRAEAAADARDWLEVQGLTREVLALDPDNQDAPPLLRAAEATLGAAPATTAAPSLGRPATEQPSFFAGGRYEVRRFLGEGGKKRVFLAHDVRLDRDVAFALIKTDGLDDVGRERITREAQAMGRLGAHPHVVTIFEIGEEGGAPYVVTELLGGGDVEGLLAAEGGALPLARTLEIAKGVARGLAFAHQQGVVHRDLKPGNVWLTSSGPEGVAKIGDFGLAVSLDRSRLTTHGLMVGTVAYMPPEQALGGEVTPQADLYSLGAMLYELVTGKPPFAGDSPTAIISQHINTPPVAPSWHSEHCPPDLEALILRLLAKVPADRPASAQAVLEALERVDPEGRSAAHSDSSANPLDRLARGVFVGRERELERLRSAFDEAFAGHGSVVMLVGEPGIGKTRTSLELETYARMRGARVIWGRAHEAAGAPPYRPWVQAADTYASTFGLDGIGGQLAVEDAAELSRIFPLLRQQRGYVAPPEIGDPAAGQFRLFEAYTKLMRAFASEAPLVVVLDDLHWADKPTLLLLQHVARELARLRVLIVGTYRDTELSRTHPLSETLAELNREGGFQRINLGGLGSGEVAAYIRGTAGIEPSRALVDRVFEETEGNPFFLAEVVNLMTEEGTISSHSVSDIAIPEGVREALGRRLDRLSGESNALLQYASIAGRQFAYDTLKMVTEQNDETLVQLIEEGLAARVIEETAQPGRYQFTHALMQETLLEELSTTRRVRMHGQIAEAIERRYGDRSDEQAARLAMHFLESATLRPEHLELATRYLTIAARQAETGAAWSEAARHWGAIIALVDERGMRAPSDFTSMLIAYGRAKRIEGDPRPGWRALLRARELCREQGTPELFAAATLEALAFLGLPPRLVELTNEALAFLGEADPDARASLLAIRARQMAISGQFSVEQAQAAVFEAERSLIGAESFAHAALLDARGLLGCRRSDLDEARSLSRAFEAYDRLGHTEEAAFALLIWNRHLSNLGALDDALEIARRGAEYCRRAGAVTPLRGYLLAIGAVLCARSDPALDQVLDEEAGLPGDYYGRQVLMRRLVWSGRLNEAIEAVPRPEMDARPFVQNQFACQRARIAFLNGDDAPARQLLGRWGELGISALYLDEAFMAVSSVEQAAEAYRAMCGVEATGLDWAEAGWTRFSWEVLSTDRLRGDLALRLGLVDEAEQHFRTGLEWCERERCPVEAGRNHQGLADVAEARRDHAKAMEHLDAAAAKFAEYGAKLYLDQVLAKKPLLGA